MASPLKKWLRKEEIYDPDLEAILTSQGVADPATDFKSYTQSQWDDLYRKSVVERAKDLKDQKAKVRMEKKMTKLEKYWRKQSGVKSTSIKKSQKSKKKGQSTTSASKSANAAALKSAAALKKYLQKNQCFDKDLLVILSEMDIKTEDDLSKIDNNSKYDEIYRKVRVSRAKDLKDNAARIRMEKLMTKFEKLWRKKTGVSKKKSQTEKTKKSKKKKDPTTSKNEELSGKGKELKQWMKKNEVWESALYEELISSDITTGEQLKSISQKKFDTIIRRVRVDRFSQLKDQKSRNRADKLLIQFEKLWRKQSGIKSTSIQSGGSKYNEKRKSVNIQYNIGQKVLVKPERKGQIVAVIDGGSGKNKHFAMGQWYGVRLVDKNGNSDGRYKNQDPYYFKCPENYGIFVQAKLIAKGLTNDDEGTDFDFMNETKEIEAAKAEDDEKYDTSNSKLKALKTEFKKLDTDGSLSLEEKEFVPLAVGQLGCKQDEALRLFKEIDVTNNGSVSFAEFDSWLSSGGGIDKLLQYADLKKAFKDADKDGNMTLDLAEFVKLASESMNLEEPEATKLFKKIDANENGNICFAEFEAYVDDLGGMENFGVYSQIIEEFKKADKDDSGGLDLTEFTKLVKTKLNVNKFKAAKIFNSIDKDKNETVSLDEFEAWVQKIGGVKKIQNEENE